MRLPLNLQIDALDFSDDDITLLGSLVQHSAADTKGAIVLVAAAMILAREHPAPTAPDTAALTDLCAEFADLVFDVRHQRLHRKTAPVLRVVGGRDV